MPSRPDASVWATLAYHARRPGHDQPLPFAELSSDTAVDRHFRQKLTWQVKSRSSDMLRPQCLTHAAVPN